MRPPPAPWPRISSALFYDDPRQAIDFLVAAFGFEVELRIEGEGGAIVHSELTLSGGLVMVGQAAPARATVEQAARRCPRQLGGANTQQLFVYVDDVEAHCLRARAAGAKILSEPATTDYGEGYWSDRGYQAEDPGGHRWSFAERLSK